MCGVVVRAQGQRYDTGMSTLAEIASAAERLPIGEQHELLQQLATKLRVQPSRPYVQAQTIDRAARQAWVAELEKEAKAMSTGRHSMTTEQLMDELREDRI
jgi:predicted transcriptional regulator